MDSDWISHLAAELGVDLDVDEALLLDVAKEAAHAVERPAAPLTTFLVGYAAGQRGGGIEAVEDCARLATDLATSWPPERDAR